MSLYQVMDEENQCVASFNRFQDAVCTAQDFTVWDEDHYYHVEELDLEVV